MLKSWIYQITYVIKNMKNTWLVGFFCHPFEKYVRQIGSSSPKVSGWIEEKTTWRQSSSFWVFLWCCYEALEVWTVNIPKRLVGRPICRFSLIRDQVTFRGQTAAAFSGRDKLRNATVGAVKIAGGPFLETSRFTWNILRVNKKQVQ